MTIKPTLLVFCLVLSVSAYAQPPAYTAVVTDSSLTGYYFLSVFRANYQGGSTQIIMDAKGNAVYYRKFPLGICFDFKVQPNGVITYNTRGKNFLTDSTLVPYDSLAPVGYQNDSHEFHILPNGHFLMTAGENVTMDLSSYPYFHHNGAAGSPAANVLCGVIQELDENKNPVYEWHVKDHIPFNTVDTFWLNDSANVDWNHANAIEADADGNLLISSRHLDEITKINKATGDVMWRLGGKYNQFTFLNDTVRFSGQHDIRRLANGNITLFDNGWNAVSHGARALEYHLDESNLTAQLVSAFVFDSSMHSYSMGNNQRAASGNRIIDYGVSQSLRNICFSVVKPDNTKAFELFFYDTMYSYRTFYYPELPFSFPRPQVTCLDSSGAYYLQAPPGYASYRWNTGAATQSIPLVASGSYSVFVPYGQGGFLSSETYLVTDIINPCAVGIEDIEGQEEGFTVYPNPAHNLLNVECRIQNAELKIYDVTGRTVYEQTIRNHESEIRNSFSPGLYFVQLRVGEKVYQQKLVVE
jgi:hypothetical protein